MKQKTVRYYLLQLPRKQRFLAFQNTDKESLKLLTFYDYEALILAFSWTYSNEGFDFWDKFYLDTYHF